MSSDDADHIIPINDAKMFAVVLKNTYGYDFQTKFDGVKSLTERIDLKVVPTIFKLMHMTFEVAPMLLKVVHIS